MQAARSVLLVLLAVALTTPPASASLVELEAPVARSSGQNTWQGELGLLLRESDDPAIRHTFQLTATDLHLETDAIDPVLVAGPSRIRVDSTTTPEDHQDAKVTGTDHHAGMRWMLVPQPNRPAPRTTLESTCLEATPPASQSLQRTPKVALERGAIQADVADATVLEACSNATLHVEGDFLLVLWEWDIHVESPAGESQHWSGVGPSQHDPIDNSASRSVMAQDRELFLYAHGANLSVPLAAGEAAYLAGASGTVAGSMHLEQASGTLHLGPRTWSVEDQDVLVMIRLGRGPSRPRSRRGCSCIETTPSPTKMQSTPKHGCSNRELSCLRRTCPCQNGEIRGVKAPTP